MLQKALYGAAGSKRVLQLKAALTAIGGLEKTRAIEER